MGRIQQWASGPSLSPGVPMGTHLAKKKIPTWAESGGGMLQCDALMLHCYSCLQCRYITVLYVCTDLHHSFWNLWYMFMKVQCCPSRNLQFPMFFSHFISSQSWSIYFSWTPCMPQCPQEILLRKKFDLQKCKISTPMTSFSQKFNLRKLETKILTR